MVPSCRRQGERSGKLLLQVSKFQWWSAINTLSKEDPGNKCCHRKSTGTKCHENTLLNLSVPCPRLNRILHVQTQSYTISDVLNLENVKSTGCCHCPKLALMSPSPSTAIKSDKKHEAQTSAVAVCVAGEPNSGQVGTKWPRFLLTLRQNIYGLELEMLK